MFAVFALSVMFRQSSANGDGEREHDRKEGFHGTTVLRCCPLACVYAMVVGLRGESPLLIPQTPSTYRPHAQRPLSVVAMRVCDPDRSPVGINR
jgi:hypothetical protein